MSKKDPYRPRPFRPKKNERKDILEFLEIQDNLGDSIRYLIEKEIVENGVRNLQEYIPAKRNKEYFRKVSKQNKSREIENVLQNKELEEKIIENNNLSIDEEIEEIEPNEINAKENIDKTIKYIDETEEIPDCYF